MELVTSDKNILNNNQLSKIKICMYNVTTALKIGGIETYYWEVSKELTRLNYDVEIICGLGDFIKYSNIKTQQFSYIPRNKIINLGNRFKKWGERISFFLNSYSYLKNQTYDYILIHKPLDFFVCYFMKKLNPEIKTIFISGGEDFYGFDKFLSKYIDFMFSVSNDNAKKIGNRYCRIVPVIPNGVDTAMFKPDHEQKILLKKMYSLENKKILISVGRIVGWKGFQLVIQALDKLPDFQYLVIGDGKYLANLQQFAKDLKVDDRVLFLGAIKNTELSKFLNIGDIFIQPSIGHEAFGITIIEAMACGLPAIVSKNGGMLDIVEEDINGYFFKINNTEEMIKKIQDCFLKKEELSLQAIKRANHFTWEKCIKTLLAEIGA